MNSEPKRKMVTFANDVNPYDVHVRSSSGSAASIYNSYGRNISQSGGEVLRMTGKLDQQKCLMPKKKSLQQQLAEAQQAIDELKRQNRNLQTLHKRQDNAIEKYDQVTASIPKILHTHSEQLRMFQTKYYHFKKIYADMEYQLKQKEEDIERLTELNAQYKQQVKDKKIQESLHLIEQIEDTEQQMKVREREINTLQRKIQLKEKTYRQQLESAQKKRRNAKAELEKTLIALNSYRKLTGEEDLEENMDNWEKKTQAVEGKYNAASARADEFEQSSDKDCTCMQDSPEISYFEPVDESGIRTFINDLEDFDESSASDPEIETAKYTKKQRNSQRNSQRRIDEYEHYKDYSTQKKSDLQKTEEVCELQSDEPSSSVKNEIQFTQARIKTKFRFTKYYKNMSTEKARKMIKTEKEKLLKELKDCCPTPPPMEELYGTASDYEIEREYHSLYGNAVYGMQDNEDDGVVNVGNVSRQPKRLEREVSGIRDEIRDEYKRRESMLCDFYSDSASSTNLDKAIQGSFQLGKTSKLLASLKIVDSDVG